MKTFILSWRSTEYYISVKAENLTFAKLKFCKSENVNALICSNRIVNNRKFINQSLIKKRLN